MEIARFIQRILMHFMKETAFNIGLDLLNDLIVNVKVLEAFSRERCSFEE